MSSFDIIALIIVGVAAVGGFMRGLVQEVLSLAAWILAIFAIHYLHLRLYDAMVPYLGARTAVAVLAFALLLLIPYAAMKLIAQRGDDTPKSSILGPIDRILGFGFGAIKGAVIVVLAFSLLVLGYDPSWGIAGRPTWMTTARTYPVVNASANSMVPMIEQRRPKIPNENDTV
ncbi:MAG: CvpA family protein [Pontixanthobacter sp.]